MPVTDYSDPANWIYLSEGKNRDVDVFLISPTVYTGEDDNMSVDDTKFVQSMKDAVRMQLGLYEDRCRVFSPLYRQSALKVFTSDNETRRRCITVAYSDISAAFRYYLDNYNDGRPFILAGFSQGAHMCYRIIEEYLKDDRLRSQFVAAYVFGWPYYVEYEGARYPVPPAKGETDTGVIITFDCEAPEVEETIFHPIGRRSHSINPLNWRTDSGPADASLNKGARIMRSNGEVKVEIPNFCGCYIDPERGALKVPGVDAEKYKPIVPFLPKGGFHLYDYEFFYHNLKENVSKRIDSYLSKR